MIDEIKIDKWPREKRDVVVILKDVCVPQIGYMKYAAGDRSCPYFVVMAWGRPDMSSAQNPVVAWSNKVIQTEKIRDDIMPLVRSNNYFRRLKISN